MDEEIIEISDGVLRLIDFYQISSKNTTSMLFPDSKTYKPTLKYPLMHKFMYLLLFRLRSKKSQIPEIVERVPDNIYFGIDKHQQQVIGKLSTFDGKNVLIFAIIHEKVLLVC